MKPNKNTCEVFYDQIEKSSEPVLKNLLRKNFDQFHDTGSVIDATKRRIPHLLEIYGQEGRCYFLAQDALDPEHKIVAGCGIGTLQGLPPSEGIGEIRDLFVEEDFRGCGVGGRLLHMCLHFALSYGYKQIYLQTTPKMRQAQRLFIKFGFQPVEDKNAAASTATGEHNQEVPCYFILSDLSKFTSPTPLNRDSDTHLYFRN